ncbi:hypothetical protein ACHAPE_008539 [Trichoderma viride]
MHSSTKVGFFRLITLSPGRWGDETRCTLKTYDRIDNCYPPYKALSYVWGCWRRRDPPEILVNGNKVKVTTNLEIALKHLRKQDEETIFWIDALCIDQSNIAERSSQVAQMREIYSKASEVIIFLGNGLEHSAPRSESYEGLRQFKEFGFSDADVCLASQHINTWKLSLLKKPVQPFEVFCFLTIMAQYDSSLNPLKPLEDIPEDHFTALSEAIRRILLVPWWDRIWVVQEAVVAETLTVRCGNVAVSWKLLVQVARILSRWESVHARYPSSIPTNDLKVFNLFSRVIGLDQFRKSWRESQGADLLSLLRYFGQRIASDDRDRVYGLLGLSNEATYIRPDYGLDAGSVYMAPVIEAIMNTKSLSVLYGDHSRKGRQDLPSWVPDWNAALEENERQRTALPILYGACRGVIPMLVIGQDNLSYPIKKEMSLILRSLMAERDPENLLQEELAQKLRSLNIRSSLPILLEIKRICQDLAAYCPKDGHRDLPRLSLIRSSEKSLILRGRRIGVVSKITEPLYTCSDMSAAGKILEEWWTVAEKRPVMCLYKDFLRTIMSDAKKSPDGLLSRLQPEDMAMLEKWFREKTIKGLSEGRHHAGTSVGAEFDGITEILRLSATRRTLFFINETDDFYNQLQQSLDNQRICLEKSRKLLDQNVKLQTHLGPLREHVRLLRRTRLLKRSAFVEYSEDVIRADSFKLNQLFAISNKFLNDRWEHFYPDEHVPCNEKLDHVRHDFNERLERLEQNLTEKEEFLDAQRNLIDEHSRVIDRERKYFHTIPSIQTFNNAAFAKYGHVGLGPMLIKEGDEIYILPGSTVPLVLRPINDHDPQSHCYRTQKYQLLGDCFLHGVMDGELGDMGGCILDYIVYLDSHYAKFPDSLDENVDATSIERAVNAETYNNMQGEVGDVIEIEIE